MRIKDAWNKWRYLGYDRETTVRYRPESDRANLHTLKRISIISLFITAPLALTFGFLLQERVGALLSAITFAFMLGVFFLSRSLLSDAQQKKTRAANQLVLLVSLTVYALGIYSGVVANKGELSVVVIWLFLLVQICFDLPPLQNALTVLPCAALFMVLTCLVKPAPKCWYDILYAFCSIVVGLYVSHHQTRLSLDNIIAKNCLTEANFALYHTCTTDELTGLSNRRSVYPATQGGITALPRFGVLARRRLRLHAGSRRTPPEGTCAGVGRRCKLQRMRQSTSEHRRGGIPRGLGGKQSGKLRLRSRRPACLH